MVYESTPQHKCKLSLEVLSSSHTACPRYAQNSVLMQKTHMSYQGDALCLGLRNLCKLFKPCQAFTGGSTPTYAVICRLDFVSGHKACAHFGHFRQMMMACLCTPY